MSFLNQYQNLGDAFFEYQKPEPVKDPKLIIYNIELAGKLGLSDSFFDGNSKEKIFSGNTTLSNSQPVATVYAGHQFGHFNPQLGDGRAILLGQIKHSGKLYDIQLKGSGKTNYSRNGDGRSALGPVIREYLLSEAMFNLGVPTTRALAAVTTGEQVLRERLTPGGIITRVASSFVRIGTFEYFRFQNDIESIAKLSNYVIDVLCPDLFNLKKPYLGLLEYVITQQTNLIAKWMSIGFIHGVMNTDNMSISGETIDYGPCAFMDHFSFGKVYSSIDHHGRYAYNKQPSIGLWNLTRFAECLIPLLSENTDQAIELAEYALRQFEGQYQSKWLENMRAKLGFSIYEQSDKNLIQELFKIMAIEELDFTTVFFYLSHKHSKDKSLAKELKLDSKKFIVWVKQYDKRIALEKSDIDTIQDLMKSINPVYIPRNHHVESAIRSAEEDTDFSAFYELNDLLKKPYQLQKDKQKFQMPPEPEEIIHQTFCGT